MDKGTLGYFNHILSTHLTELERDIRVLLSSYDETGDGREPMDEVDATASRSAWEDMVRMQHRSRMSALEIRSALQRIRNGDFGICLECGDSIGLERLKAYPMTTVCIMQVLPRLAFGARKTTVEETIGTTRSTNRRAASRFPPKTASAQRRRSSRSPLQSKGLSAARRLGLA